MAGIAITRGELTAVELRAAAGRTKDARAARRMLAIALVVEGVDRATAAATCGMDRRTLRDCPCFGKRDRVAFLVGRSRIGIDRRPVAELAPVRTRMPPGNSLDSIELPASRDRAGLTRSRSAGLSEISGSSRPREVRLAISTVGNTASIGPGAW